jgi:hypothetical protein
VFDLSISLPLLNIFTSGRLELRLYLLQLVHKNSHFQSFFHFLLDKVPDFLIDPSRVGEFRLENVPGCSECDLVSESDVWELLDLALDGKGVPATTVEWLRNKELHQEPISFGSFLVDNIVVATLYRDVVLFVGQRSLRRRDEEMGLLVFGDSKLEIGKYDPELFRFDVVSAHKWKFISYAIER